MLATMTNKPHIKRYPSFGKNAWWCVIKSSSGNSHGFGGSPVHAYKDALKDHKRKFR